MSSIPEKQPQHSVDLHEGEVPPEDGGWKIAVMFVGFALVVAILFTVYVLAWDGGAHT